MIWLRRLICVPLSILFTALLLATLILIQVSNSLLDPDFYLEEMSKADIYEFAMDELLTTFIDEARENHSSNYLDQFEGDLFSATGLTTEQVTLSIRRVVPPKLVQLFVEQSFREIGNYITGEQAEFTVHVKLSEQSETLISEIKSLINKLDVYNLIFEKVVTPKVKDVVDSDLPLGVTVSNIRVIESIQTIVPSKWAYRQAESAIDGITPYLLGETDNFEVRISLEERSEIAGDELKRLLKESVTYNLLYDEIIVPNLTNALADHLELPYNLTITDEEILYRLRQAASIEWAQIQIERVINDATPYLLGKTDSFSTVISLADSKRKAGPVISDLVDTHFTDATKKLPTCGISEAVQIKVTLEQGKLPYCLPRDIPTGNLLSEVRVTVSESVTDLILSSVPDRIRVTDTHFLPSLNTNSSNGDINYLNKIREIFKNGWVYTDEDLRKDVSKEFGQEGLDIFEGTRFFLGDGVSYGTQDLQAFKALLGQKPPEAFMHTLNGVRDWIKPSKTYKWVIWLPTVFVLILIGMLSGRGWYGRIIYGSIFLAIASGIILVVFGPLYDNVLKQHLENHYIGFLSELMDGVDPSLTTSLFINKVFEVSISIADRFTDGIFVNARNIFVISLFLLGVGMFWESITGIVNRIRILSPIK
ncbi:hypothetical protein M1O55_04530 [Dehalococcoidia bacterium]|nr:hypothetical protein [Dehalococcoidia bacterium]